MLLCATDSVCTLRSAKISTNGLLLAQVVLIKISLKSILKIRIHVIVIKCLEMQKIQPNTLRKLNETKIPDRKYLNIWVYTCSF